MRFEMPRARRTRVDAAPLAAAIIGLALMPLPGAAQTSVVADQAYSIAPIGVHVQKYLDIPDAAKGPAIPDGKAFRIQELGTDLYMISDNVYQSMFLVYDTGVVVVDAPPAYASHIPGAIAEIAARPITHVIYSHSHSDHVGGTTKLGGNPIIIAHEETRRLLQSAADPNRPVQLQQVILNLLLNAAEAMSEVAVRARELTIRSAREGSDRVRMTVRDTGAGVDPQSMHKLFEAFYTTKRGGMGIGLSVSRSIIERHHGRLWVEPNDGPRATFALSIPRGLENKLTVISMSRCFRVARGARTRGEGRLGRRQLAERAARCFDAT